VSRQKIYPFGVNWKKEREYIFNEANDPDGRFSAGLPKVSRVASRKGIKPTKRVRYAALLYDLQKMADGVCQIELG